MNLTLAKRIAGGGWKVRLAAAIVIFVAVGLLGILVDLAVSHNRIHPGVTLSGRDVGRMKPAEATALFDRLTKEAASKEITLTSPKRDWHVMPTGLRTRIDVEGSVADAKAVTSKGNLFSDLFTRLTLYFRHRDVPLRGTVDTEILDKLVSQVAEVLDVPPVNAGLKIESGQITVVKDKDGRVVDQDALRTNLKSLLFSLHSTELPVPMKVGAPLVRASDAQLAIEQVKQMISKQVALKYGEHLWTITPEALEDYIDFRAEGKPEQARLAAFVSPKKLASILDEISKAVDQKAQKATWETDGETATIVPSQTGREVDREATAAALTQAALSTDARTAQVKVKETKPSRSTEEAKKMGIVRRLGAYSTEFGGTENRRDNIQRAAELIDGTVLAPGEEFDFDRVVGARTAANGFKTAPVIISGGKLDDALGGGICQVATTLFNAVFFAGLDVTARYNHSLYISHYPKGRDATVTYGGAAFRFRNDTEKWILIRSASSRSSVTFILYGTPQQRSVSYTTSDFYDVVPPTVKRVSSDELPKGETRVTDDGQTGRKVKVVRVVKQDGETIHKDTFISIYPMFPKVIAVGTKMVTTTTTTTTIRSTTTTKPPSTTTTTAGR